DVNALLVGPTGLTTLLLSDTGGAASAADVTFAEAGGSVPATGAVTTGTYIPTDRAASCAGPTTPGFPSPAPAPAYGSSLSPFNGTDANGTWSLYVMDGCAVDSGSLAGGWGLNVAINPTSVGVGSFSGKRTAKGG